MSTMAGRSWTRNEIRLAGSVVGMFWRGARGRVAATLRLGNTPAFRPPPPKWGESFETSRALLGPRARQVTHE